MKAILALESSSPVLSLALIHGRKEILEKTVYGFSAHAENLLPALQEILKKARLSFSDIGLFLVGRGPGSFTGLRVGFATLKGFLIGQKRPCLGAVSLDLVAENAVLPEGAVLAVALDARRERIYSRLYRRRKNTWKPLGKPAVHTCDAWIESLPEGASVTGDALQKYGARLEALAGKKVTALSEVFWYPRASKLAELYLREPEKLQKLETPKDFLPLYFRLSEAEERRYEKVHAHAS